MSNKIIIVTKEYSGTRIDKFMADYLSDISRSYFQKILKSKGVKVNDVICKANYKVNENDIISIEIPENIEPDILPEDIPLQIIFEDHDIIIINKPKGMVVHPAAGHYSGTLVNALMHHCKGELSGINGVARPGIVHRIDKDTTGVLIACKNDYAHNSIALQLKEHSITRKYVSIVHNVIKHESGVIKGTIGRHPVDRKKMSINTKNGKEAITHYKVLKHFSQYTYIECILETGRTHQIRVHMASIGHPILGDILYGPSKCPYKLDGQTLHAQVLGFIHPRTNNYMEFSAPVPDYFEHLLKIL